MQLNKKISVTKQGITAILKNSETPVKSRNYTAVANIKKEIIKYNKVIKLLTIIKLIRIFVL